MKKRTIKVAFLDCDGTLVYEPPDTKQIDSLEKLRILPGVLSGLKQLRRRGFMLVMVSNQDGVGTPSFPLERFEVVQQRLLDSLRKNGIIFDRIYICPHFETDGCMCRKPNTGLVNELLLNMQVDTQRSFVLGDRRSDAEFAKNIGIRFFAVETNNPFPKIE